MEKLTSLAQSLSPYIIISVIGDPIKTLYVSTWATKSPMPHVWTTRLESSAIVNIWDLPSNRDRSASMIPNDSIDHFIILYDTHYRSLFKDKKDLPSLNSIIKGCSGAPVTIIIHGNVKDKDKVHVHLAEPGSYSKIIHVPTKNPKEAAGLVKDISTHIYEQRVSNIDKQIRLLLNT